MSAHRDAGACLQQFAWVSKWTSKYERRIARSAETQHHLVQERYSPRIVAIVIENPESRAVNADFRGIARTVPITHDRQIPGLSVGIAPIETVEDAVAIVIDLPETVAKNSHFGCSGACLLYTSPSPRDRQKS